jgi:cytochrome P450
MARNPFMAKDEEWKQLRGQTAPALTSNKVNKQRQLIDNVSEFKCFFLSAQSNLSNHH